MILRLLLIYDLLIILLLMLLHIFHTRYYQLSIDIRPESLVSSNYNTTKTECSENFCTSEECRRNSAHNLLDRWIVISVEQYQRSKFQKLNGISDWQIAVVEDGRVHNNKARRTSTIHWVRVNPSNKTDGYPAKNHGYLYAIENGARFIYDVDDQVILDEDALKHFDYDASTSGVWYVASKSAKVSNKFFDPYQYFDSRDTHSKAYAAHIKGHKNMRDGLRLCKDRVSPPVQHALARQSFRLKNNRSRDDEFSRIASPISLSTGTHTAWLLFNTLFHYNGFFALFMPVSTVSSEGMILRSYYIKKLLDLTGCDIGFYPPNARILYMKKKHGKRSSAKRRKYWSDRDVHAVQRWISELKAFHYDFPKLAKQNVEPSFKFDDRKRGQNCRPVGIDFSSSTVRRNSRWGMELPKFRIEAYDTVISWCSEAGYNATCQHLPPPLLANTQMSDSSLMEKLDTVSVGIKRIDFRDVLVIIDNYQRKSGFGLLQRLYQPYFGLTIFCGSWKPDKYRDDGKFPEMIHPFNYIHVSATELVNGTFMYYCLAKVRELKLRNVKGYFMIGDDVLFQFWHKLNLKEILYPTWIIQQRCPSSWWPTRYGRTAAKRAYKLFTKKYRNDEKVKRLLECYGEGLSMQGHSEDAATHIANDNGWTLSDFYYVPQKRLNYMADALEVFFEAELFVEHAMNKLLYTVSYNKIPPEHFSYLSQDQRSNWRDYYKSELIMMHPVKTSNFGDLANRIGFCNTFIRSYGKALFQC